MISFAFSGVALIGIAADETGNLHKVLPVAIHIGSHLLTSLNAATHDNPLKICVITPGLARQ